MTALERYNEARGQAHIYRDALVKRSAWQYIFKPFQTMKLVHLYLDSDQTAWIAMRDYMNQLMVEKTMSGQSLSQAPDDPS